MKRVGIYGKTFHESFIPGIQQLFDCLTERGSEVHVCRPFHEFLKKRIQLPEFETFRREDELRGKVDVMISIGGDGTILNAATMVNDSGIPILGINTGRLGFLSTMQIEDVQTYLNDLMNGNYSIDSRRMLQLETKEDLFSGQNFALNELVLHKKDSSSMISIHTYLDDEYLCTYWSDGIIISTPTGSTAYSLSCGGPIILPDSNNLILNPIAPHNLNSRPLVIPDNKEIKLRVEGRSRFFLISLDSRVETIDSSVELVVKQSNFPMNFIRSEGYSFLRTINKKLHWGFDERNR